MKQQSGKKWIASITLALTFLTATCAWAQDHSPPNDDLFAGTEEFAHGATKTTEVNLDKSMLGLALGLASKGGAANKDEADLAKGLAFVYVREYDYAKAGQYKMADVQKFIKRLDGGGWVHMVRELNATENTDICMRTSDEGESKELVIIAATPKQLTFVHLKGRMPMDELSRLGQNYGAPALKKRPQ